MGDLGKLLSQNLVTASSLEVLFDDKPDKSYYFPVSGSATFQMWHSLRAMVEETGYWPIVLGNEERLEKLLEVRSYNSAQTTSEIIREGLKIDPLVWLKSNFAEAPDYEFEEQETEYYKASENNSTIDSFLLSRNTPTQKILETVLIGLLPTTNSWETVAIVKYGGWNACPVTAVHVSIAKRWQELYGAEIAGVNFDCLEFYVNKPPTNFTQAFELAQEHYTYCSESEMPIRYAAKELINSKTWFFWWD
jgi:hypothetical protein